MYNNNVASGLNLSITNLDSIKDREYVTYTTMPSVNGHRFVYINNDLVPGEFLSTSVN